MAGKGTDKYDRLGEHDESIYGYQKPSKKHSTYAKDTGTITYEDRNGATINLRQTHVAPFLRELRKKQNEGWEHAPIFESMKELSHFEEKLQQSNATAYLDYCLLKFGAHIRGLQGPAGLMTKNEDALELNSIYSKLVKRLGTFEQNMETLNTNASRHQNEKRTRLVVEFSKDWANIITPAIETYQNKKDTYNILLNVAAAFTIVGALWLLGKNIYRLSQNKGLGLFQFEQAHSRKVSHLQSLHAHAEGVAHAHGAELKNFFTHNFKDAEQSRQHFEMLTGEIGGMIQSVTNRNQRQVLQKAKAALDASLHTLYNDINAYKNGTLAAENVTLEEAQVNFMESWRKDVEDHNLAALANNDDYSQDIREKLQEVAEIAKGFEQEIKNLSQPTRRSPSPGYTDSDSDA